MSNNSSRGSQWNKTRLAVLIRDNYLCVYCGNEATEADHVVPKAKGGQDVMDNLVACCRRCNASKQDKQDVRMNWFNKKWLTHL